MNEFFNAMEALFFTELFGKITLYMILSTVLKFVFVLIVLSFVSRIVRMITMDIQHTATRRPIQAASLRLLSNPEDYDFPLRDEYYLSDNTSIGRADDNTIVIKDRQMSKHQAVIVQNGSHFFIDDLQSTNPTTVNDGIVLQPTELHSRDIVSLGGLHFVFLNEEEHED